MPKSNEYAAQAFYIHGYLHPQSGEVLDTLMEASGSTWGHLPNLPTVPCILAHRASTAIPAFLRLSTMLWARVEIKERLLLPKTSEWTLFRGGNFLDRKVVYFNRYPKNEDWTSLFNGGFGVYHSSHEYLQHLSAGYPVEYRP